MKHLLIRSVLFLSLLNCTNRPKEVILHVKSGTIERITNFTSAYVVPRNIDIWLPEGYTTSNKFAVLYMHDGQMLFDSSTTWNQQEWGVDETISKMLEAKKLRNTIVVGIWNTDYRHSEYFPQKPFESLPLITQDSILYQSKRNGEVLLFKESIRSDAYLQFIVKELKPRIDSTYATLTDRDNTFIAGSSMGGLISMYAICEYPEIFGGAACMSTHWPGVFDSKNNPIPAAFISYLEKSLLSDSHHKIYFDYGTETLDAVYEPYQQLVDAVMIRKGFTAEHWKTMKFEGDDHSEKSWNKRLHLPLGFLLENRK